MRRAIVATAVAAGLVLPLAACQQQPATVKAEGVELVLGVHANQPKLSLTSGMAQALQAAIVAGKPVGYVAVDGAPRVLRSAAAYSIDRTNTSLERNSASAAFRDVNANLASTATTKGSDLLDGLVTAAEDAASATPAVHSIFVLDNGLSDTGILDLTRAGMLQADPKDLAAQLISKHEIEPTTFRGDQVTFAGLGTAVAAPQSRLSQPQIEAVRKLYSAIVTAGGGTPMIVAQAPTGSAVTRELAVRTVARLNDSVDLKPGITQRFGDESAIGFRAGTAQFRSAAKAAEFITPVARWLEAAPSRSVSLVGTTSSEGVSRASDLILSKARASAVEQLLINDGVSAAEVHAMGKGYIADPPDETNGTIVPEKAALNRVVRITLSS